MWKEMNCVISVYGFVQVFIWHAKIYLEQGKNKLEIEMIKTKLSAQSVYVSEYSWNFQKSFLASAMLTICDYGLVQQ